MITKCRNIEQFEFKNDSLIIRLHKGNPVYGNRLCVYKRITPLKEVLIYDKTESGHNTNGWIKDMYIHAIDVKINKIIDSLI